MRKLIAIAFMFFVLSGVTQAQQKYGHVNFGNLLELMPEITAANVELEALQETLIDDFEQRRSAFEAKFAKFQSEYAQGLMSRAKQEEAEAELRIEQQELMQAQNNISEKIQQKRTELMAPIVMKVQNAINEVGEDEGFSMIFDVSLGAILHAQDSQDLDAKVRAKLKL